MSRAPSLLAQWKTALVFRIGENDGAGLDQFPDFRNFPMCLPSCSQRDDQGTAYALGSALACCLLKLYRPWPVTPHDSVSLDPSGGWLYEVVQALGGLHRNYAADFKDSFFMVFGTVVEMALNAPDRLAELNSRIDALDNAMLHDMALAAVQGESEGLDLFEGVYE